VCSEILLDAVPNVVDLFELERIMTIEIMPYKSRDNGLCFSNLTEAGLDRHAAGIDF